MLIQRQRLSLSRATATSIKSGDSPLSVALPPFQLKRQPEIAGPYEGLSLELSASLVTTPITANYFAGFEASRSSRERAARPVTSGCRGNWHPAL